MTERLTKNSFGTFAESWGSQYLLRILKEKILHLSILLALGSSGLSGQEFLFDAEILNVEDGLPQRSVYDIDQDKNGYIWLSLQGIICRYDGYDFKTYNASRLGILDRQSPTMEIDHENRLWYAECIPKVEWNHGGVLDIDHDTIYQAEDLNGGLFKSTEIYGITRSKANPRDLFFTTNKGIVYKYDGKFEEIFRFPIEGDEYLSCESFKEGIYWIWNRQQIFEVKNRKVTRQFEVPKTPRLRMLDHPAGIIAETINSDSNHSFWQLKGDKFVPFTNQGIFQKEENLLKWTDKLTIFNTDDALFVQNHLEDTLLHFNDFEDIGLRKKLIPKVVFTDAQNIVWVGTENGLIKITARENPFKILAAGNSTRGIFVDKNLVYIGGYSGNMIIDLATGREESLSEHQAVAMSFTKNEKGIIRVGTDYRTILKNAPGDKEWEAIEPIMELAANIIFENQFTGNFLAGTLRSGVMHWNEAEKTLTPIEMPSDLKDINIRSFYQNEKGIWVTSNRGVFLLDNETEELIQDYSLSEGLPHDNIQHLHEDEAGIFWLASRGGGLIRWDVSNNKFRQFTREDGLTNDVIYAVYEDEFENLWLPSNYGLMSFDKKSFESRVYLPKNGIAHEEFNTYSHCQSEDGTLYFGGLVGVTQFDPKEVLKQSDYKVPLHVSKVSILEKDSKNFVEKTTDFDKKQSILLTPGDRVLNLEMTFLDYVSREDIRYAYKIEGFQDQWIYTKNNLISIVKPGYGYYHLKIKAQGASGVWSDEILEIPMLVAKPFYLQNWFLMIGGLSLLGLLFGFYKWRVDRLEKRQVDLENEVKARTHQIEEDKKIILAQAESLQELDKAKTRFFSNITHEIRTPLTLILGPLEQTIDEKPTSPKLQKRFSSMLSNARHLAMLINQLLDISKLEGGLMKTEIMRGDLVEYTQELVERFQPAAMKKELSLGCISNLKSWETNFDPDKWNKIVYNLLSNAVKFTPNGGTIKLGISKIEKSGIDFIQFLIRDTGVGIEEENLEKIFDRFYQADNSHTRAHDGTGIGLSLVKELVEMQNGEISVSSEVGKGTEFKVILPVLEIENLPDSIVEGIAEMPTPQLQNGAAKIIENEISIEPILTIIENEVDLESPINSDKLDLLIIEDNDEMRDYIRSCIDDEKYNITEAADGEAGLQKALTDIPDLIISDVMMPKRTGFEVTESVRNNMATSHIPIVLLTAKAALESRLEGIRGGADVYLTKPFSAKELVLRIDKLLEIRRLLQHRYSGSAPLESTELHQKEDEFITKIRSYVLLNLDEVNINGDRVGKHMRMSRGHLHRKLKALTGQSISEFVKAIRLAKALEFVHEKQWTVSEITDKTGFSSISQFSRSFKAEYGKSPSEV